MHWLKHLKVLELINGDHDLLALELTQRGVYHHYRTNAFGKGNNAFLSYSFGCLISLSFLVQIMVPAVAACNSEPMQAS